MADRMLYASDVRRSLGEWLDEHRPEIGRRYRALWIESKCITAARALISDANRTPYAGDPDLKEIRVAAGAALDELQHALWQRSWKEGDRLCCGTRNGAPVGSAAAAETTAAPGPHSGTPATVEGVSVAHSEGE